MDEFIIQEQSWYKRKNGRKFEKQDFQNISVLDFKKIENHQCIITAALDGDHIELSARVFASETYRLGEKGKLERVHHGWKVQGIDALGNSIILKLKE